MTSRAGWKFWIDRGGTFTDVVAVDSRGHIHVEKLLSENPELYEDAAIEGIRNCLMKTEGTVDYSKINHVRMGTTIATNALLEKKGVPTLFVVNSGFKDLLLIGRQSRPKLFDLQINRPEPLHDSVMEITARYSIEGERLGELDKTKVLDGFERRLRNGCQSCAVSLVNAWKYSDLEKEIGELAKKAGFANVSLSHEIDPLIGYVERSSTTVLDAYITPPLKHYTSMISRNLSDVDLHFMQSSGGLAEAKRFKAKDAILSGPSGGVVGAIETAKSIGYSHIIGFDMGGTSTDISVCQGNISHVLESDFEGVLLRAPMVDIHTIAAGGGSIIKYVHGRLQAGPESAGAKPGPAAYRNNGPATVTDANLVLGRIQAEHFPAVFGSDGNASLDTEVSIERFVQLAKEISLTTGKEVTALEVAAGGLKVAVDAMVRAIRKVTLEAGIDPKDFALQCFGGAAGQHACLVAEALGISKIIIHPLAGVLSAYGIGLANESTIRRSSIELPLDENSLRLAQQKIAAMQGEQERELSKEVSYWKTSLLLRYKGSNTKLETPLSDARQVKVDFEQQHLKRFGFSHPEGKVILDCVVNEGIVENVAPKVSHFTKSTSESSSETVEFWSGDKVCEGQLYFVQNLKAEQIIEGPAIIIDESTTIVVDQGWRTQVLKSGELILSANTKVSNSEDSQSFDGSDPVTLELFSNRFMAVAEHMGAVLCDTSVSVNIRERLDFSCGIFDSKGQLLANAPHMPVHLGAMGESVRTVIQSRGGDLKPGDMVVLNNPFNGGSHLPDITVIAPVFDETDKEIRFFVANRGHHADIGGLTPGSTPPNATKLEEEGVVIDDFLICEGGKFREQEFRKLLIEAPWPARNPDANVSDLKAQIAANMAGINDITELAIRYSWDSLALMGEQIMDNAEESMRSTIVKFSDGKKSVYLDDGAKISVEISIDKASRSATVDFSGTDSQRDGNFNAPPAVSRSAVLYVFRCLTSDPLPLNEGCLRPLNIIIPEKSLLSPAVGAAVVAGNTEVSQQVCNALLGALNVLAASQGTMNNLLFGNENFQYYETICGGYGAGRSFDGTSAIHSHMTNTRITDVEVLELNYPLRVEQFEVRENSGGAGLYRGGDGAIRRIKALEEMTATVVASSRNSPPFGLNGGSSGKAGTQYLVRAGTRTRIDLSGVDIVAVQAGDMLTIETPGGGGYG